MHKYIHKLLLNLRQITNRESSKKILCRVHIFNSKKNKTLCFFNKYVKELGKILGYK